MKTSSVRRPVRVLLVLILLGTAAAVFAMLRSPVTAQATTTSSTTTGLTTTWHDGSNELEVTAIGYRKRSITKIRIGSDAWREVRADANGTVQLTVELGPAAGRAGTSVLVSGQAASNGSRTLVGGLPPAASAHGPRDALPWALAGALVLMALITAFGHRPRRGVHRRGARRETPELRAESPAFGLA
ncbi:hypothetical protein [Actinoplanes sp. N902-109]|uniref:hypothetical protein n=1 Tax=Actinoplanes sp. (strain N902-109) TaxID=649831 RepID=UPI0003293EBD|nr:hypothetical protein [Actinoplanes sp. N902-109]AGL14307.1 hypothetical protein L083_0797 [Actinoplanes sp. N902-109]